MIQPTTHAAALDDDLTISRMAQALSPYKSYDIEGFARLALIGAGFARTEVDRLWRRAVQTERARRMAFAGQGRAA